MFMRSRRFTVSLLLLTAMIVFCSCTSPAVEPDEKSIKTLEEIAEHSDILHFQEHKVDYELLEGIEEWCMDLYTDNLEYVEYTKDDSNPSVPVDKVLWYLIRYQSGEEEIGGYICAPKDYLEKDYPVLIYNRGGWGINGGLTSREVQYSAQFGFIVLATAYRGGGLGGTGKDEFSGEDVNDVIKLIDFAEEFAFTNGKMYMFGWSRGGTETYNVLKRDERLDAAVAGAGPTDMSQIYFEENLYGQKKLESMIGGTPETHPEEYEARSAMCWPEKINTPLWIVHGTADDTVLVHHSEDLYNIMNELGKDVKLTLYPDMDHTDPLWAFLPDYVYWLKQH